MPVTSTLDRLILRLTAAGLAFEVHDDTIIVPAVGPRGFDVTFAETATGYVVGYDGWQEHFGDEHRALHCFSFGLSDRCRLKVFKREGGVYRWTVEYLADGQWLEGATVGKLEFPLWQERDIEYRQNAMLRGAGAL